MTQPRTLSTFSVFRNRNFTRLWLGQLVSSMGNALTALASSILVYRETESALSVGLMLIATSAPTVLVGLFAGVFVDRYDRKRIMLTADLLRAVLVFLIPVLIPLHINWLFVIVALTSVITQFFDSAHASILPEIASEKELSAATSWMAISTMGSTTIGFAAAGFIATSLSIGLAFQINGFALLLSTLLILLTRIPSVPQAEDTSLRAIRVNLTAGLQAVRGTPLLRSLFTVIAPIYLIFGFEISLLLPFTLRALGGTEFDFGLQESAEGIGIAVGSLLMTRLADRLRPGQWLAISYLSMAAAMVVYSASRGNALAVLMMLFSGVMNAPSYISEQLVLQRAAPREMRGRVVSAYFVLRDIAYLIGMGLAGLADVFDVRTLFGVSAFALLAAGAVALILPGLGQPAREWKRIVSMLRGAEAAPRLGAGRIASRPEIDRFVRHMNELEGMTSAERDSLAAQTFVVEAPGGKIITYRGETSDMAYFILKGRVAAGYIRDDDYVIANEMQAGEFFGEIAALTGAIRTANIITEEESEFLILPAGVLRSLALRFPELQKVFSAMVTERLNRIDLVRGTGFDQAILRELRTNAAE